LPHGVAVQRRAVLAAEVGDVYRAMLRENPRMAAGQARDPFGGVVGERRLAAADREQTVDDTDRVERRTLRARNRRQHHVERSVYCRAHLSNRSFAGGHFMRIANRLRAA
jgi:hypothetical protein